MFRLIHIYIIKYFIPCFVLVIQFSYIHAQGIRVENYFDENRQQIKEVYHLADSFSAMLEGEYAAWFLSGKIRVRGYYHNNTPDSLWVYYYENGNIRMQGNIRNGQNEGIWEYFFENGKLNMKGALKNGMRQGVWTYFFESGGKKSEGTFLDDLRDGIWNYFYEDGTLKAQAFFKNDNGWYREFFPDQKLKAEGKNAGGKSDSLWTYFHENGRIKARGFYDQGLRHGEWTFYYPVGAISAKGHYKQGKKDEKWVYFHENGQVKSEGALRDGKKEGYWKLYNESGKFRAEGVFDAGDGVYNEYYESGKKKVTGKIKDGLNEGQWYYYYEDGNLEGECFFEQGSGNYTGYYPEGSIKMKGRIENGTNTGLWELYQPDGTVAGYYRPLYEDKNPIYKMMDESESDDFIVHTDYMKPEYRYRKRQKRYFDPIVNEFRGSILSLNPASVIFYSLPFAFEYYFNERLGYEVQLRLLRNPFFSAEESIPGNEPFYRGYDVAFRQKFYHPEGEFGVPYFGHEVRITQIRHLANVLNPTNGSNIPMQISAREQRIEYSIIAGIRWFKLFGETWKKNRNWGLSLDLYCGIGAGYRSYSENFPNNPLYEDIFRRINKDNLSVVPRLGINAGIVF